MQIKPVQDDVQQLVGALLSQPKPRLIQRRDFVATAILCLVNEGIEPHITAGLRYHNFNFDKMWVEFVPWNGHDPVRRPLSKETAEHLRARMRRLHATKDDLVSTYQPRQRAGCTPRPVPIYTTLFTAEIRQAGFDPLLFSIKRLKRLWVAAHPDLREEERRCRMLAKFVLRWAAPAQQEALLKRIFADVPVLRPSWAFPGWHKSVAKGTLNRQETPRVVPAPPVNSVPTSPPLQVDETANFQL